MNHQAHLLPMNQKLMMKGTLFHEYQNMDAQLAFNEKLSNSSLQETKDEMFIAHMNLPESSLNISTYITSKNYKTY